MFGRLVSSVELSHSEDGCRAGDEGPLLPARGDLDSRSDATISYAWDFWAPQVPGNSQMAAQAGPLSLRDSPLLWSSPAPKVPGIRAGTAASGMEGGLSSLQSLLKPWLLQGS